jgi:putative two-component system response regulator
MKNDREQRHSPLIAVLHFLDYCCVIPIMAQNRKIVIIVDDNPVNLKLARNTLMDMYDVFTVPGAEKLFELLEKIIPDIILLDVMMPGMSGHDAITILKQNPHTAGIPVVFITSKSDYESELAGFNLGAVDYISKPFSPPILLKRVAVLLLMESQKADLQHMNENLQEMVAEKTKEVVDLQNAVLKTMGNLIESRDDVTGSHIERTEILLSLLVQEMLVQGVYKDEMETWDVKLMLSSAHLHDVGKIAIRDNILMKPGPLTKEEYQEMQKHALFGEKIINTIIESTKENAFLNHARILAGSHHEKWDGTGYPRGLSGTNIPLQGRLMAIVDVYDALVSERPYKEPYTKEEAIEIIKKGSGSHFDPRIVDVFIGAAEHFR